MSFFDKLSIYNYLTEFINFRNSTSSSEEFDVSQRVTYANKIYNFHVLNGKIDCGVTSVDFYQCEKETLQEATAKSVEIMQPMKINLLNQNPIHDYFR